jgi:uncharacterized membrane protein
MKNEELDQILNQSFKAEPQYQLSFDFARKLGLAVARREQWKTDMREYLLIAAVVAGLIALVSGFYFFVDKQTSLSVFQYVSANWVQVLLIALLLNFILFADRVLLRLLFNRWNRG